MHANVVGCMQAEVVLRDPETGAEVVQSAERDRKGELANTVQGYTRYYSASDVKGERLRIEIGPVNARQPRT